jgi:hypothetical protein
MDIASGKAEDLTAPASSSQPGVVGPAAVYGQTADRAGGQGGVADTAGQQRDQAAAGTADMAAAQSAARVAELGRRTAYDADMRPAAASYGDAVMLPQPPSGAGVGICDVAMPVAGEGY